MITRACLSILAVFAPIQGIVLAALFLIVCDLMTGVWAARKRGETITSLGLRRTIVKLLVYETAIVLGFVAQHFLMEDLIPLTNIIGTYIGLTELTSAYENLDSISGGGLLKAIITKLGNFKE